MFSPLEDIRFLADSENRFRALETLAAGPRTRSALRSEIECSKATISRLLGDFESRGWVTRAGKRYALTPLGEFVATEFIDLHDHMATAGELRELLPWFPLDALDIEIELEVLSEATITAATPENPMAPVARVLEIERDSSWTHALADRFPESCIRARHGAVVGDEQRCELIITPNVIESVMSSSFAGMFEEIVAAANSSIYVYDGDVPPGGIHDGTAYLIVADDRDVNVGVIESDDPALVDRLSETFDQYRNDSIRLTSTNLETAPESVRAET